jgi:AcrR family transcriptional regulator
MRADAKRNQERLLEAAIEMILEVGAEPPLDAIARGAGVGIGTLYRHFPDRGSLLNAVAEHVLDQAAAAAEKALTEAPDGYDALRQYMHVAVDRGVGVLNLIYPLLDGPDWTAQRTRMATLLGAILERGKRETLIRDEVRIPDIVFAIIRFSRPVAIGLSRPDERAIAHRHLDIYIDGLGITDHAGTPLAELSPLDRFEPN